MYLKIAGVLASVLLISGCTSHSPSLNTVDVTNKDLTHLKSGKACGTYILGLIGPFGQESIVDAAIDGNVTKIKALDKNTDNFLIFSRNCITVHGE